MDKKSRSYNNLKYLPLAVILIFLFFPIYWMIMTSLKTNLEAYTYPPSLWPNSPTIETYISLFNENSDFFVYYKNNFITSGLAATLICFIALTTGYALSRLRVKWNKYVIPALLFSQMFPVVSRLISLYGILTTIGLINTRLGLIFAIVATQIPFTVLLMSSFFDSIPRELEDAAFIDGASRVRTLTTIIIPLVKPGILAVGIYSFLLTWDDYLHASTLIQSDALRTLSVGITLRYLGESAYDWSLVNSISVVGTIPMVLLFFFFQKYMVKGLTAGAVKG